MVRVALALISAVLAGVPGAGSGTDAGEQSPVTGINNLCNYQIRFAPTRSISQAVIDVDGQAVILLDPSLRGDGAAERRLFLILHECAHHRMGHAAADSVAQRTQSGSIVRDQELSADCWAAEMLARHGNEHAIRLMELRFHRAGLYSPGQGYPSGLQRSSIVRQCAAAGRRHRRERADVARGG